MPAMVELLLGSVTPVSDYGMRQSSMVLSGFLNLGF